MNNIKGGTPKAILEAANRVLNVGTPGHIDHGQYSMTMKSLLTRLDEVSKCTCLTKSPKLMYHHRTCKYLRSMEDWKCGQDQTKKLGSETPTDIQQG